MSRIFCAIFSNTPLADEWAGDGKTDAVDVANIFIELANADENSCMTNLQLNELVYLAQAWSLEKLERALFEEEIQAWKYGPIIPSVYHEFKKYGKERIAEVSCEYAEDEVSSEELDLLLDVAEQYRNYSASKLREITHKAGGAWSQTYDETKTNQIPKELIRKDVENEDLHSLTERLDKIVANLPQEGRHDENGHLILPIDTYPD